MLDASVLMMQQYCAAAAMSTTMPIPSEPTEHGEEPSNPHTSAQSEGSDPSETNHKPNNPVPQDSEPVPSTSSGTGVGENDELRRRRLQHFEQQRQ